MLAGNIKISPIKGMRASRFKKVIIEIEGTIKTFEKMAIGEMKPAK